MDEAQRPWCRGVVVRDLSPVDSNWRSHGSLEEFLVRHRVPALVGIDTRRLTRHLREHGALAGAFGHADEALVSRAARLAFGTDGQDLVSGVSTSTPYQRGDSGLHVVAVDYGIKRTMVDLLAQRFNVTVVPSSLNASQIRDLRPDGLFLSNGPGDPAALVGIVKRVCASLWAPYRSSASAWATSWLASALGASTYKLPFGHHGSNHPVRDNATGRVEITAQNHNYAVAADSLDRGVVSHVNLNDGVIEGISSPMINVSRSSTIPKPGPDPTTRDTFSNDSRRYCATASWSANSA